MPTLGGSPALQSPPMGPKRRVVPPGAARTCRRGDRIATRRMSLVGRCCRKRDFAMSGEQHRFKIKCKCPILIQKSARRDSIVSNSNSTVTETFSTASVKMRRTRVEHMSAVAAAEGRVRYRPTPPRPLIRITQPTWAAKRRSARISVRCGHEKGLGQVNLPPVRLQVHLQAVGLLV